MSLSEFEIKRVEKIVGQFVVRRRPVKEKRSKLDLSFRISDQSFEIFDIRPQWDDPTQKIEGSIAKATFVKSTKRWKLYWKRADMKWHGYEPFRESDSIEEILEVINQDKHGCLGGSLGRILWDSFRMGNDSVMARFPFDLDVILGPPGEYHGGNPAGFALSKACNGFIRAEKICFQRQCSILCHDVFSQKSNFRAANLNMFNKDMTFGFW